MPYIDSRTSDLMRTVNDYRCHPSSRWRAGEITENTVRSESVKFQMPSQVTFDTVPSSLIWNLTIGDRLYDSLGRKLKGPFGKGFRFQTLEMHLKAPSTLERSVLLLGVSEPSLPVQRRFERKQIHVLSHSA
jgi:hypothetical protein